MPVARTKLYKAKTISGFVVSVECEGYDLGSHCRSILMSSMLLAGLGSNVPSTFPLCLRGSFDRILTPIVPAHSWKVTDLPAYQHTRTKDPRFQATCPVSFDQARSTLVLQSKVSGATSSCCEKEKQHDASANRFHKSSPHARRIFFPMLAMGMALLAAFGVVEIGLRIFGFGRNYTNPAGSFFEPDSELGCHGKPNFIGRFHRTDFDVIVEHDAGGFRSNELPMDAMAKNDIYVLGDSFVWGYGVGQHDLLTNQMQRLISGQRVHNLGLIGAGTVEEYLLFQKHVVDRLRPGDTVVLVFFNNDFGDNVGLHSRGRMHATIDNGQVCLVPPAPPSALRQWKNWLKDTSYLFNLVTYCLDRFHENRSLKGLGDRVTRPLPTSAQIQADASDTGPAVQITRYYVSALKKACAERHARFLIAYVPGQAELGEDDVTSTSDLSLPEEIASRQAFGRMVHDLAIETVDLMPAMVAAKCNGRFDRMTFTHDFHWNAAGHSVAAETIAAAIR
jgi:lysophospholipase L1-like esterase